MAAQAVAIYGATGHTGRFVARELERRGCRTVSICRGNPPPSDEDRRGARREWRRAACDDPDSLDAALRETDAVINCAGPFLDTAPALLEAALRANVHYFDITAEQRSVRQSLATYDEEARQRRTVVLPAMAFYGGLADLLAAEVTRGAPCVESIEIGIALDSWHPTQGTRETGIRNTARRLVVADGQLTPLPQPASAKEWMFPEPFGVQRVVAVPLSEIIMIHRHVEVRSVCSYMNFAPLRDLEDPGTPPPTACDSSGQSSQRFVMDVRANWGDRRTRIAASGRDIYAVTAPIVVEACLRVLEAPPVKGGAYAAGELFDAKDFLAALKPQLEITRSLEGARANSY